MHYLITGGLGVIGSAYAEVILQSNNHYVDIIDSCEEPRNLWTAELLSKYGNVRIRRERLERASLSSIGNYDVILHAAASTGIPHSAINPDDDWVSNVDATRHLLEALRHSNVKRKPATILLSSVKPYAIDHLKSIKIGSRYCWSDCKGVDENFRLEPDEPYAASKMAQSALGMAYARSYDLPVTVLRCSNMYGAGPCHGPRHGWLTWMCISAIINKKLQIQGDGFQSRDMLYSSDVIRAIDDASLNINNMKGQVYNIGGGLDNCLSVVEAVEKIQQVVPIEVVYGEGRKHEDLVFVTDFAKFNAVTNWQPLVRPINGIERVMRWAKANEKELRTLYEGYKY